MIEEKIVIRFGIANICLAIFIMGLLLTGHISIVNFIFVIFFSFILFMLVAFQSLLTGKH